MHLAAPLVQRDPNANVVAPAPGTVVDAWKRNFEYSDPKTGEWRLPSHDAPIITLTQRDASDAAVGTQLVHEWWTYRTNLQYRGLQDAVAAASRFSTAEQDRTFALARTWGGSYTIWCLDQGTTTRLAPGASRLDVTFHDDDIVGLVQGDRYVLNPASPTK
jgi:hypothetical protein